MAPSGPFETVVPAILLLCPFLPLFASWGSLHSGQVRSAKTLAAFALVLALVPTVGGILECFDRSPWTSLASIPLGFLDLDGFLDDPPNWAFRIGAGAVSSILAFITLRTIDAGGAASAGRFLAGRRVRRPRARAAGAARAPRG